MFVCSSFCWFFLVLLSMNGMLSRTSGNSLPPAQLKHQILQSKTSPVQAQKRHCKSSSRSGGEIEPTSVLDIRSPSPTSTLSSSLGGSSESAGAVAAVSGGLLCEAVSDGGGGGSGSGGAETLLLESSGKEAFNNGGGSTNSPARWYPNRGSSGGSGREGFGWRLNNGEQQPGGGGMLEGKSEVKKEEPQQQQSRAEEWGPGCGGGPAGVMEDLESMLLESGAGAPDQSLMRWLLGEIEDPKDLPPPQIKANTSGGSASAAHFEDPSIEPNFGDPVAFSFSSNNISDVIAPPQPAPPPSSFRAPYPTLSNQPQQQFISPPAPPPPPPPPPPFAYNAPIPTPFVPNAYHPEVLFSAPAVYGSNPAQHFGPDFPRFNMASDPTRNNNNLLFDMPLPPTPKRFGLEHQLWQQTFKQQEYMNMMKPQHQQELLQSLQRRQQFLHQPPPPPPHHQQLRQKAIVNNTLKVESSGAAAEEVQVIVEQLLKAAEAVELGNLDHAQAILARLNQHLSPLGKPLHRAAFYFKEALASRILNATASTTGGHNRNATGSGTGTSNISPLDMVHKISAYKSFSEASPLVQFAHFTANQALLEALDGAEAIHIIDFEIGLGGQWASFLQELAVKLGGAPPVRLTALGSSASSSLELHLTRDNLCNFAKQLNVPFEFELLHLDRIESLTLREREAVAVNLSLLPSTFTSLDSISRLLNLIKNLSPRAVVAVDAETTAGAAATSSAASFVHHFLEALQFYSFMFDSLDAVNINMDAVHKIEKFLLAPKIDATISSAAKPPWKTLFASAGFSPVAFSNFTETQAEYLIQRLHGRGFEVLKAHTALLLGWQGRPLVSATAWRCGPPP